MKHARLAALDVLRGIAVLAMAFYHFSWDLSWFQITDWAVSYGFEWRVFAAAIAGTFLFLSGVTLALAHGETLRWRALLRSKAILLASALAISGITYFVFSANYVRFGILHNLLVSGILALPFLKTRWWITAFVGILVLSLPLWAQTSALDGQIWLWTGLGQPAFGSVDYVPLAPWAGLVLLGVSAVQNPLWPNIMQHLSLSEKNKIRPAVKALRFTGKHSLSIYLLHQPILFGLVWLPVNLGLLPDTAKADFVSTCTELCEMTDKGFNTCENACKCTLDELVSSETWEPLVKDPDDPLLRQSMNIDYAMCLSKAERFQSPKPAN